MSNPDDFQVGNRIFLCFARLRKSETSLPPEAFNDVGVVVIRAITGTWAHIDFDGERTNIGYRLTDDYVIKFV